jgi:type II secretion system (T2SS) protein E
MQRQMPSRDVIKATVKHRLGQLLIDAGIADEAQLRTALSYQRRSGCRLGQALIHLKRAKEAHVVQALSRQLKCAHVDLAGLQVGPAPACALKLVPPELALRKKILPVGASENTLTLAMADPSDAALVRDLSLMTGRRVNVGIAGEARSLQRSVTFTLPPARPVRLGARTAETPIRSAHRTPPRYFPLRRSGSPALPTRISRRARAPGG